MTKIVAAAVLAAACASVGVPADAAAPSRARGVVPILAFDRGGCVRPTECGIFVLGLRRGSLRPVEVRLGAGRWPAWSPDGRRIAFADDRDGDFEIFVMNADGTDVVQLTHNDVDDGDPSWSPDAGRLAFTRFFQSGDHFGGDIYVMDADGGGEVNLTNSTPTFEETPSWSKTGKIAFARSVDIWIMDPDGSNQVQLTDSISLADYGPDWSPDGLQMAFTSQQDAGGIFTMSADGSDLRHVPNTSEGDRFPSWGALGAQIAFSSATDSGGYDENVFAITPTGDFRTQLTRVPVSSHPDWRF
jgi:Tol biopolymer transport system component